MKVSRRGGFSDRNGIKPENTLIQVYDFDKRTRVQLQNMISKLYASVYRENTYWGCDEIQDFFRYILGNIYAQPVDALRKYDDEDTFGIINNTILEGEYDDVLTLVEGVVQYWDDYLKEVHSYEYYSDYSGYKHVSIYEIVNGVFEREYIGYRFIDGRISPISDQYELDTITDTLSTKYSPIYDHISKANRLLSDREKPDYENSIKESISAVEAICIIITGESGGNATLGKMLKKLEDNGVNIHGGLKSAFNILYGYTSDANGIRHAGDIGGEASTFEEAKFMLVSCCAFINYLLANKANKLNSDLWG